ncbi:MAG: ABC transporter permease [Defluviitaleaceae bacterium]|nr:ABC transporter permease [Defluviitaleaceae bacterium]
MVIRHYFKRIFTQPINLLVLLALPVGILILNLSILNAVPPPDTPSIFENPASIDAGFVSMIIIIMFAFFGASVVYDYLFEDIRGERRWRLLAAPQTVGKYVFANVLGSTVFSLVSSVLIYGVGILMYDAYVPNLWVVAGTIFLFTVFAQLLGMFLLLVCPKKGTAEAALQGIVWSLTILTGNMFGGLNLGRVGNFIFQRATPNALAMDTFIRYITDDMVLVRNNMLALGGYIVVMAIVVAIVARRRPF